MGEVINFDDAQVRKAFQADPRRDELNEQRHEAIKKLPRYRGAVPSKTTIRSLPHVVPGEIFWVESDNKAYIVAEKDKKKMTIKALDETATISTGVTIFDMNKRLVSKEPIFDITDKDAIEKLNNRLWTWFNEETTDEFYCLYGRNIHYLTVLQVKTRADGNGAGFIIENEFETLIDILKPVGDLISIDFNTSDDEMSLEIWVRTRDSDAELLYLFPYDRGIVKI
jgi:hypothetical protein